MIRMPLPLLAVALSLACSPDGGGEPREAPAAPGGGAEALDPFDGLVAAERAFSAMSVEQGMRAAFLANFAPDVVTFDPAPVVGTAVLRAGPAGPPLEWWPELAEVSAAGDMGYTTGPYRVPRPDGTSSWGHYHSVWGRRDDGSWVVLLDAGGPHAPVAVPAEVVRPSTPPVGASVGDAVDPLGALLETDRAYAEAYADDPGGAVRRFSLDRSRFYSFGQPPLEGVDAALSDREVRVEELSWSPEGGGAAASGDLGYTWGTGTVSEASDGGTSRPMSYARVWRATAEGWRVALEIVLPHAPPA